ncbi:MAG: N-acetyl-gamma-glutamyl-phosphate reductase [Spirochaetes bacterium]|nr:MAG: N-acetyl-gamma-glutamyl-phosphate reductase [Spirochaetota bacterium]
MKTAVLGISGYTGLLLLRILHEHPNIESIIPVTSSHIGEDIRSIDHGLSDTILDKLKLTEGRLVSIDDAAGFKPDVVFAALPHLKSAKLLEPFFGKSIVIDLSADFRIKDPSVFKKAYGEKPPREDLLPETVYGLCEWNREKIKHTDIIANPGCYPTATLLPLLPLLKEKLISGTIITNAISGISGGGKKAVLNLLYVERSENASAYLPGKSHRHQPEIEAEIKSIDKSSDILFTPHLVPLKRGITVSTCADIRSSDKKGISDSRLKDIYESYYGYSPFIRIRGTDIPETRDVWGTNRCDIGWRIEKGKILLFSVIDNLIKGASGQAVQNMNIRVGFNESAGLRINGEV